MPDALLAVAGGLLVVVTTCDALATTLGLGSGARPLSRPLAALMRLVLRLIAPRLRSIGGPLVLLGAVALWIGLLWTGYSLLFLAAGDAITSTATGEEATVISRVYYAGYTLFTLGNGGYSPSPGPWQIATVLAVLNGLFVVTLAITYLIPVLSAAVERRRLAGTISSLGDTAEEAVCVAWNGRDFSHLESQLPTLAREILLNAQRQLAYPVLNDFQSDDPRTAAERSLALLDEVITILELGVAPDVALPRLPARMTRFAIDENRRLAPVRHDEREPPPVPDLTVLASRGVPTVPQEQFAESVADLAERRGRLAAMVEMSGSSWPTIGARPT